MNMCRLTARYDDGYERFKAGLAFCMAEKSSITQKGQRGRESIETYVNRRLSVTDQSDLPTEIAERANGVFLWARFAIDDLIDGYAAGDTAGEIEERLRNLPEDLKDMYERILRRIRSKFGNCSETSAML